MSIKNKFDEWLVAYQEDFAKIIGKHRYSNHAVDFDDLLSEINLAIFKDKEKILKSNIETQRDFNKLMYSYARNHIKWKSDGLSFRDKKYIQHKKDSTHTNSEGSTVTLFELICDIEGEEDKSQSDLNKSEKVENIIKYIKNYSHFLSPHQKNVLDLLLMGKNFPQMAELLSVSHQAVQSVCSDITAKIKSYIKVEISSEDESKLLSKGHESIKYLFGAERLKERGFS